MSLNKMRTMQELAKEIAKLSMGIAKSSTSTAGLKLLASIKHSLNQFTLKEDLTLPLFPDTGKDE